MLIEVIATNVEDAINASENGADRIELVSAIKEGGLTPSYGMILKVLKSVHIPVNVMIRPHSKSFNYDTHDIDVMMEDIKMVRELGAAGIVIGVLDENKRIDQGALEMLLSVAGSLDVTFHRAFDEVEDQEKALQTLLGFKQINRILTSGGKNSVLDATDKIKRFVTLTENKGCTILAGAGLTIDSLHAFLAKTDVKEVHFGSGVRYNGDVEAAIEKNKLTQVRSIIDKFI